jgi:hypothetical protein
LERNGPRERISGLGPCLAQSAWLLGLIERALAAENVGRDRTGRARAVRTRGRQLVPEFECFQLLANSVPNRASQEPWRKSGWREGFAGVQRRSRAGGRPRNSRRYW